MESWKGLPIPVVPGEGRPLRLFDTATGEIRPTAPGKTATIYVCGITPYDATHMGHAATYVAFDILQRIWRDGGHDVKYVQNVTDIDDPLLERAVALGQDWRAIAERETEVFRADMYALGVIPPADYIGAVEAIPSVADHVSRLQELGAVYPVDDDLYFSVHADRRFGSVTKLDEAQMIEIFAERGGDPGRPGKRHPLDCLVWQAARPGEPAWDTRLGHGRPGWHIECVAIALDYLGMPIDVQGGGSDLAFPHHEMGASEAQVLNETWPYARHYVHTGMVGWQGHKMSKSRGNLVLVSRLRRDGVDPMAIRLALLANHYRSDWAWNPQGLSGAIDRLALWRTATAAPAGPSADALLARVRELLSDDMQTPTAMAVVDRWAMETTANGGSDKAAPSQVASICDALLGVRLA
ncbi:MAG: cysteine--1-D-myo-inosityl 2-amino-2-deoxy-alpha-D-glucopyranoside ligase [Candidatus Nanopelagicales bacterium]|nr:cysteine--1-D-myo-inosityl 2-amino-2-deoxy-alpha-D-glucopyranoside ligase [Candidatus Nanopelagicales bacterium]